MLAGVSSGTGLHAARVFQFDGVKPLICDVVDDARVAWLCDEIVARGAGPWGLVDHAGVAHLGDLVDVPIHETRSLVEVNVFGVQRVTQASPG